MSVFSILLRLLLSVALILNGSGIAKAHVGMTMGHATGGHAEPAAKTGHALAKNTSNAHAAMGPDCHHIQAKAAAAKVHASKAHASVAVASGSDTSPGLTHCCQSGNCRNNCTQHCAAVLTTASVQDAVIPRAVPMRPVLAGHLAPALPHLIRPPIG